VGPEEQFRLPCHTTLVKRDPWARLTGFVWEAVSTLELCKCKDMYTMKNKGKYIIMENPVMFFVRIFSPNRYQGSQTMTKYFGTPKSIRNIMSNMYTMNSTSDKKGIKALYNEQ
jgi:hypothetical protein